MGNTVLCAGIALINRGKIFLIKPFSKTNDVNWGIPKGHIDDGESELACAVREFTEETGISINQTDVVSECFIKISTRFNNTTKIVAVYKYCGSGDEYYIGCNNIENGPLKGCPENIDGQWFTYDDALEAVHPYQKPIIEKLKAERREFKNFYNDYRGVK